MSYASTYVPAAQYLYVSEWRIHAIIAQSVYIYAGHPHDVTSVINTVCILIYKSFKYTSQYTYPYTYIIVHKYNSPILLYATVLQNPRT